MAEHFDIAIVGGGIIGASLANHLVTVNAGRLRIALIESRATETAMSSFASGKAKSPKDFNSRVVALSAASQAQLQALEVWQEISPHACPYREMEVWDEEGTGSIHFDCADIHEPALGYIVENHVVVQALFQRLKGFANVHVLDATVTGFTSPENADTAEEGAEAPAVLNRLTLDNNHSISADLVVAADGARSQLRQWMAFDTREWDYDHTAIVTTVTTSQPHRHTAWQCFSVDGPVAFLPLHDEFHCSIVWSLKTSVAEQKLLLDDEAFCRSLTQALQARLGPVVATNTRMSFPLRQRHSKRYVKDGLVLLGDAAHTVHPLAGQGANLGLYDVDALAKEIARACSRQLAVNDASVLHRFERQRMPHNLMAMATLEGFKQLFGTDNLALRWMRNTGMSFLNRQPLIKNQLAKIASGKFI
ncbi:2-octaprenylphenol hydroxylase [Thalassocella blandensis]|nr:2-octaprenylphenol hydroxylase [Thalassocella blandensis]